MINIDPEMLLPRPSRLLLRFVRPLNRFFDWLYHSRYNPLYRSGTLAVGLLLVLLVTGLYLICFYRISEPFASVEQLHSQAWAGRWVRSLHRYSTDAAMIAILFHMIQLFVQGKTWGPRLLAWLSGVILLGLFLLSAWTGYVLVWDQHAQYLAVSGAELLRTFPFLYDVLGQAFDGSAPINQSFFFMNLFLHIALPMGLILGLWIHTAKLSRSKWFPIRPIWLSCLAGLFLLSVLRPAQLLPEADLLKLIGRVKIDLLFGFWIPFSSSYPALELIVLTSSFVLLALVPLFWKPATEFIRKPSVVDPEACSGCTQCARDCPYEAIVMEPREDGRRLVARVFPESCVSCGVCSASCADLAIGPPDRSGPSQTERMKRFLETHADRIDREAVVVVSCIHNGSARAQWEDYSREHRGVLLYPADCCGSIHTLVLESLLGHCGGVLMHACPERNCFNRDALDLSLQRVFMKRVPFLAREIDRARISVHPGAETEMEEMKGHLASLQHALNSSIPKGSPDGNRVGWWLKRTLASAAFFAVLPLLSEFPVGRNSESAMLRIGVKIPGRMRSNCRPLSEEERRTLPLHMQKPEICEEESLRYRLRVQVEGKEVVSQVYSHQGVRGDSPLMIGHDAEILPGEHDVAVSLEPEPPASSAARRYQLRERLNIASQRIYLVTTDSTSGDLIVR